MLLESFLRRVHVTSYLEPVRTQPPDAALERALRPDAERGIRWHPTYELTLLRVLEGADEPPRTRSWQPGLFLSGAGVSPADAEHALFRHLTRLARFHEGYVGHGDRPDAPGAEGGHLLQQDFERERDACEAARSFLGEDLFGTLVHEVELGRSRREELRLLSSRDRPTERVRGKVVRRDWQGHSRVELHPEGSVDEIVGEGRYHLERMDERGVYLGLGSWQVWLTADGDGRLKLSHRGEDGEGGSGTGPTLEDLAESYRVRDERLPSWLQTALSELDGIG